MVGIFMEKIFRDSFKEGLVIKWVVIDLVLMWFVDFSYGEKLMNFVCLYRVECWINLYLVVLRYFIFILWCFGDSDEMNIFLWRWM